MDGFLNTVIPAVLLIVGFYLKRQPWYATKFIPVASFVVALVIRIATGLGIPTAEASVLGVAIGASFWGTLLAAVLKAIADALIATGIHSGVKNTIQGVKA